MYKDKKTFIIALFAFCLLCLGISRLGVKSAQNDYQAALSKDREAAAALVQKKSEHKTKYIGENEDETVIKINQMIKYMASWNNLTELYQQGLKASAIGYGPAFSNYWYKPSVRSVAEAYSNYYTHCYLKDLSVTKISDNYYRAIFAYQIATPDHVKDDDSWIYIIFKIKKTSKGLYTTYEKGDKISDLN